MSPTRELKTGRYTHLWGWQGFDQFGREWSNCAHCGLWRDQQGVTQRDSPTRTWDSPEPASRSNQHLVFGNPS